MSFTTTEHTENTLPAEQGLDTAANAAPNDPNRSWRKYAATAAGGAVAALVALTQLPSPVVVEKEAVTEKAEIILIEPIRIELKARTLARFKNQTSLNPKILGIDIANDYKVDTTGVVETLTGVESEGVEITGQADGRQSVRIPLKNIVFFSRIVEDQTLSVESYDATAEVGRAVWGFAEAIGIGEGINEKLHEKDAELTQASRKLGVNHGQESCGSTAWSVTRELVEDSYRLAAQEQGLDPQNVDVVIDPANGLPDFTGPYELSDEFEYSVSQTEDSQQGCTIAEDAQIPEFNRSDRSVRPNLNPEDAR